MNNTINKNLIKLNYERALKTFYINPSNDNKNLLFKAYDDTLILRDKMNEDKKVYENRIAKNKEKLSEINELEQKLHIMDTQLTYIKNAHNEQQIEDEQQTEAPSNEEQQHEEQQQNEYHQY